MKNLLQLLPLLLLSGVATFAKTHPTPISRVAPTKMHSGKMAQDCCMMKDGKMIITKDGKKMPMTADMTMGDGTVCTTNGICVKKDGTKMTMKNDQCMMMNGTMTSMSHSINSGKMKSKTKMGSMKM